MKKSLWMAIGLAFLSAGILLFQFRLMHNFDLGGWIKADGSDSNNTGFFGVPEIKPLDASLFGDGARSKKSPTTANDDDKQTSRLTQQTETHTLFGNDVRVQNTSSAKNVNHNITVATTRKIEKKPSIGVDDRIENVTSTTNHTDKTASGLMRKKEKTPSLGVSDRFENVTSTTNHTDKIAYGLIRKKEKKPSIGVSDRFENSSLITTTDVEKLSKLTRTIVETNTTVTDSIESRCETMYQWSKKDRIRNDHDDKRRLDPAFVAQSPLLIIDELLEQTICHEAGRFRSTSTQEWNMSNTEALKDWEFKLIYLAIYDLHHRPAREEYNDRTLCSQTLPTQDFQCSQSKFLVTYLANIGMGASIRLGAVSHILNAIAIGRIPIFISNATVGPKYFHSPWFLSSCERGDVQCVFLPTTPCALLNTDLEDAFVMNYSETRRLRRNGALPAELERHRVITTDAICTPAKADIHRGIYDNVRQKVYERAMLLITEWYSSRSVDVDDSRHQFLQAAAGRILMPGDKLQPTHYPYGHRSYRIPHAILLYILRPNAIAKSTLDDKIRSIFKYSLRPETTIGMPIRGSDKCLTESTCLEFERYMQLANETWESSMSTSGEKGTLIMTTEDEAIFRKRVLYNTTVGFPLDFVVNEGDSLQGTGNVKAFGMNADEIIMSSLIAIRMQLQAGHVFGNCCSNFHLIIFDFAIEGCGLTTKVTCLQETKKYMVCCEWSKSEECVTIKDEYREAHETPYQKARREARHGLTDTGKNVEELNMTGR